MFTGFMDISDLDAPALEAVRNSSRETHTSTKALAPHTHSRMYTQNRRSFAPSWNGIIESLRGISCSSILCTQPKLCA